MATCVGNNTLQIVPYECPSIKNITCTNGRSPVLEYDEYQCCQHYECDCECKGWGDHRITFDGLYYGYQGNCSYYLMKEISPMHDLEMYIDNNRCDPTRDVSCRRSLIVNYGKQSIKLTIFNLTGQPELEAYKNEVNLRLPFWEQGVKVMSSGVDLALEILRLRVVVTFGKNGFSVNLPYKYFGGNTEGQCGTCTNNQKDDCGLQGGKGEESCALMADSWLLESDKNKIECKPSVPPGEPLPEPTPCNSSSICDLLLSSVFAQCRQWISADTFYKGCAYDSCRIHSQAVQCATLEIYAAACAKIGMCINWRSQTDQCASNCPSNKIYRPCGPADQPSCEDSPNDPTMNFTTEGCFCPEGMKLFSKDSNICVKSCGCLDPDGTPREFNETFEYKCQNCVCDESTKTVICKPKPCPTPAEQQCSGPGYVLVNQTDPSDPCCTLHVCQCESRACPEINMNCPVGFRSNIRVPKGKCCPERRCERKRVCVQDDVEYRPGSSVPAKTCEDCTCSANSSFADEMQIVCRPRQCKETCAEGFEYVKTNPADCCGACVQTHCVINVNGSTTPLKVDETWSPPENKCESKTCVKSGESFTVISSKIVCPFFQERNCKKKRINNRTIDLACENGGHVQFTYEHIEECGCGHTECTTPAGHLRRKRRFTLQ
ncbi:PREDICTED: intestinal mucin-like protein [Cyprinodon variegatus]|uniref:intestinal mucin-like protein n=1 Tax=Cyprinodon variegatus TaxID=28743 RepID=UPI000742833A|nr:PREDICTED: intestinal mucin-like protein [Cyprinodon variegatus]